MSNARNLANLLGTNTSVPNSICQVVYGWAVQNNTTISAGNASALTYYTLSFTPKFSNSLCIYETTITGQSSSDNGYVQFYLADTVGNVNLQSNSYIAQVGYSHTEWLDIPIRSLFIPSHTNAMTIRLYAQAFTGDFASNWSAGASRLMTVTEIAQ